MRSSRSAARAADLSRPSMAVSGDSWFTAADSRGGTGPLDRLVSRPASGVLVPHDTPIRWPVLSRRLCPPS